MIVGGARFCQENMSFFTEPSGYEKTILSDLQGAWLLLREAIVIAFP
jgi:hypothetical protein